MALAAAGCAATIGWNRLGWIEMARIWFPSVVFIGIAVSLVMVGGGSGIGCAFLVGILLVCGLHTSDEWGRIIFYVANMLILSTGFSIIAELRPPALALSPTALAIVRVSVTSLVLTACGGITLGISWMIQRNELKLQRMVCDLKEARAHAESALQAKTDFLANMTHEIRTPLSMIINLTELTMSSELRPQQRDDILQAHNAAEHLLDILNDILDLSKIESGYMMLSPGIHDLDALVKELFGLARQQAIAEGLGAILEVPTPLGSRWVDAVRLKQVLLNLLNNAVKFTMYGEVKLKVTTDSDDQVHFAVSDTGIGMTPEQRERIFDAFYQASQAANRKHEGTGLGTSISFQLIQLMGGELRCESVPDQGSTFWFTISLPTANREEDTSLRRHISRLNPLRLLVAEDNAINQMIIRRLLEQEGFEVKVVGNGQEAVEEAGGGWDAILMDMQMPEVDGLEATRRLRAKGCTLPIIALTANALEQDRRRCLQAGMNHHLAKPLRVEDLNQILIDLPYLAQSA
ncbi:MAG: ATP-binding protein [Myxococcota bacterium]